jgi:hypothetical protein
MKMRTLFAVVSLFFVGVALTTPDSYCGRGGEDAKPKQPTTTFDPLDISVQVPSQMTANAGYGRNGTNPDLK